MPELFGYSAGQRLATQDIMARRLSALTAEKEEVQIAQAKMSLASQQRMLNLMQGTPGQQPTTEDLASSMDRLATIAMQSGLPEQAKQYATAGTTLRKNAAEIADKQTTDTIKNLNIYSSLLTDVKDEAGWKQANAMFTLQTGRPSPYANIPYNPLLVDRLKMGVQTAKDRALTEAAQARIRASQAEEEERKARVPLIKAQTAAAEARTENLRKTGARPPSASDLKAVTDLIVEDYGGSALPEDMRNRARPIAERMRDLMRTENLTQSEAATRAYQEAKRSGDLTGMRTRPLTKGAFRNPLELPMSGGKVDPKSMKENMWYNVNGTPRVLIDGKLYSREELEAGDNNADQP